MNIRIILIIIIACLYGFTLKPWWADYKVQKQTIVNNETQIESVKKTLEELKELENNPEETDWENLLKKIPVYNEQEQIIRDLKRISEASGFTFKTLSFGETTDTQAKAERLTVSFSVKGSYDKLFYLLSLIQQNPRYIGIKDLKLTSQTLTDGERRANMNLSLFVLHQQ